MRSPWPIRHLTNFVVVATVTVACSSAAGGDGGDSDDGGDAQSATSTAPVTSPLREAIGEPQAFGSRGDEAKEAHLERQRAYEQAVAACMKAQGFEYIPVEPSTAYFDAAVDENGLEVGSEEWTAVWGFGITTSRPRVEVGPNVLADDTPQEPAHTLDPNEEIRAALDLEELNAYHTALSGPQDDDRVGDDQGFDEAVTIEVSPEERGCQGTAEAAMTPHPLVEEFAAEFDDLGERIALDPRLTEFDEMVASCLAAKQLSPTSFEEFREHMWAEMDSLEYEEPVHPSPSELEAMTAEEMDEYYSQPPTLTSEAQSRLGQLQQREIEYAVATLECGGGPHARQRLRFEITAEYEQRFIDENQDRLGDLDS